MYINGNIFLNNGSSKEKTVEWFEYSENLYKVLDQNGIISRMKNIPQLGVIKVNKKFYKSRFDYFFIQMYLHELIGKELKNKLEFSYNSTIKPEDFYEFDSMNLKQESLKIRHKEKDNLQYPTILNFLQLFTLVSNIGFFRNTFVSSYATIILANKNSDFKTLLFDSSDSKMFVELAEKIIIKEDYYHLNLLNAFLILEKCGINDGAVVYAKNLIYSYLNKDKLPSNSKLLVFFDYFKAVRDFWPFAVYGG